MKTANLIINVMATLSAMFFVWVAISWFDYAANDMYNTEDAAWNLFSIITKVEENNNTGAC